MSGTVREQIAAQVKADNPAYVVKAYAAQPPENAANKVYVAVYRDALNSEGLMMAHQMAVEVLSGKQFGLPAEEQAEEALDEVLLSLQRLPGIQWSTCERAIFNDKWLGHKITCVYTGTDIYKSEILSERA